MATPTPPKRISIQNIKNDFLEVINFEKGIFYTVWNLALTPGKCIRNYLFEDRTKMVRPLKFLVIAGIISSFASFMLGDAVPDISTSLVAFFEKYNLPLFCDPDLAATKFQNFAGNYKGLLITLSIPLIAGVSYFIFRSNGYNFAEHLVIGSYLFGFNNLLSSINYVFIKSGIYFLVLGSILLILLYFYFFCIRVYQRPLIQGILLTTLFIVGIQAISTVSNVLLLIAVSAFY